jgi:ABC-type bacteriocin/lantibiotic exporter with double-glycine peptidase domain
LVRAFYSDPRFLILDVATNSLNWESLEAVGKNWKRNCRTVIMIGHAAQELFACERTMTVSY